MTNAAVEANAARGLQPQRMMNPATAEAQEVTDQGPESGIRHTLSGDAASYAAERSTVTQSASRQLASRQLVGSQSTALHSGSAHSQASVSPAGVVSHTRVSNFTERPSQAQTVAPSVVSVDHPALVSVTETQQEVSWQGETEQLNSHQLTVIVRGSQSINRDGVETTAGPVEAMLHPAGTQRSEANTGKVQLHRLRVCFHWQGLSSELPNQVQDSSGRLHELASWLVSEREAQFPNAENYRQGLLSALVSEYLRLSVVAASRIEEKTRTYMLRHLGDPITLEDLASNIGMSRYYFCRVYKEIAGHTPMEHLRALRLERAKDLIRSTALPLKAIAPEVGFGSAQHLCRLLHDRFGVGVRELRGVGSFERRALSEDNKAKNHKLS